MHYKYNDDMGVYCAAGNVFDMLIWLSSCQKTHQRKMGDGRVKSELDGQKELRVDEVGKYGYLQNKTGWEMCISDGEPDS